MFGLSPTWEYHRQVDNIQGTCPINQSRDADNVFDLINTYPVDAAGPHPHST